MIGHRSVERPSRVSTELRGESGMFGSGELGKGNGVADGWLVVLGGVPRDRAAITS